MRPLFIVLEALDGVGKTTLSHAVAQRLDGVRLDTPGGALREVAGPVLVALGNSQEARCLFYAASVMAQGQRARRLVAGGQTVVMDRYWLSTIAYARARGVDGRLADVANRVPVPDMTLVLTLDEGERRRRLGKRGRTAADRETLSPTFASRVLREMSSPERLRWLRPSASVDLTGLDRRAAVDAVLRVIEGVMDPAAPARV